MNVLDARPEEAGEGDWRGRGDSGVEGEHEQELQHLEADPLGRSQEDAPPAHSPPSLGSAVGSSHWLNST